MNAHALLTAQGWRGTGHSLHHTSDSVGLSKPLLLARKDDNSGIGSRHHTSDQWWLNAFDAQLKAAAGAKPAAGADTLSSIKLGTAKYTAAGALYARFVSGGMLAGTATATDESRPSDDEEEGDQDESGDCGGAGTVTPNPVEDATPESRRRRREGETKEERRARKAAKRERKEARIARREARKQRREQKDAR